MYHDINNTLHILMEHHKSLEGDEAAHAHTQISALAGMLTESYKDELAFQKEETHSRKDGMQPINESDTVN